MQQTNSLPRTERLARRGAIRRLFESGKSGFIYPFRYVWIETESGAESEAESGAEVSESPSEPLLSDVIIDQASASSPISCKVLFTAPKRFHKRANRRNTLRRRTKEAYRLQRATLLEASDKAHNIEMAIIYSTKEAHNYRTISTAVRKILEHVAQEL